MGVILFSPALDVPAEHSIAFMPRFYHRLEETQLGCSAAHRFGADCGARTHDLGINSPTLHQLS